MGEVPGRIFKNMFRTKFLLGLGHLGSAHMSSIFYSICIALALTLLLVSFLWWFGIVITIRYENTTQDILPMPEMHMIESLTLQQYAVMELPPGTLMYRIPDPTDASQEIAVVLTSSRGLHLSTQFQAAGRRMNMNGRGRQRRVNR